MEKDAQRFDPVSEVVLSTRGTGPTFAEILERRMSRREFIKAVGLTVGALAAGNLIPAEAAQAASPADAAKLPARAGLPWKAIRPSPASSARAVVAEGHKMSVVLRWGDPILPGAPAFDPRKQTAAAQEQQFGYNCDFIGVLPHPEAPDDPDRALIVVNHEYTNPELMFSRYKPEATTREIVDIELAAHGVSVVELVRAGGVWSYVQDSRYNRRITANTPMTVSGPAAGSDWLRNNQDADGETVTGTLNNCAGGKTPWGTILSGEENFHQYYANASAIQDERVREMHARYGLPEEGSERNWESIYPERFDLAENPNGPFAQGWVVEVDPSDPESVPVKHTALGRFKHEGATFALADDGRVVFYTGDDERFEYVYKFVSEGRYTAQNRTANMQLLSEGTLYVARFNEDGSGDWLPLVFGQGPLTAANGLESQADVVVMVRAAADLLGATRMDRPEDVEQNPVNKRIYLAMTNNNQRGAEGREPVDAANPRGDNRSGHIIEVTEAGDDPAATTFAWEIFMLCGNPARENPNQPNTETYFAGFDKTKVSPIAAPDNIAFDLDGNLWIATDGASRPIGFNDGLFAVPVDGPNRGELKQFFSTVTGSEVCGPEFTADNTSLFLAIQHPGEGSTSTFDQPITRWPDNRRRTPPRPSVIVLQNADTTRRVGA
jgi:hypothetical protein